MKKLLLGIGFSFAGLACAAAADLPVKAPPVYTPAPSWTGFYVGANAGFAWDANTSASFSGSPGTAVFFAANEFPNSLTPHPSGVLGGGQIGYNWQITNWLVGFEADLQGSGYKGSATVNPAPTGGFATFATSVEQHSYWFGTVRGRLGFLATPDLLIYGTGGLAFGQTETSFTTVGAGLLLGQCPTNFTCATASSLGSQAGWTAGAGLEYMMLPHWSVRAEYLYVSLGSQSATGLSTATGIACTAAAGCGFTASAPFRENIVRAAVNYHF